MVREGCRFGVPVRGLFDFRGHLGQKVLKGAVRIRHADDAAVEEGNPFPELVGGVLRVAGRLGK